MGGPDKVARQHEFGKLTIRERVAAMADAGSFHEIGALAGAGSYDDDGQLQAFTPSNLLLGTAEIDGRPVVLSGDDFTVRGGSAELSIAAKRTRSEGLALDLRLPHVRLVDGMGGGGSVKTIEKAGRTYIPELRSWELVVADRKSTRLNSSHANILYAVFCLKKKTTPCHSPLHCTARLPHPFPCPPLHAPPDHYLPPHVTCSCV